jgi:hypothetical protein
VEEFDIHVAFFIRYRHACATYLTGYLFALLVLDLTRHLPALLGHHLARHLCALLTRYLTRHLRKYRFVGLIFARGR